MVHRVLRVLMAMMVREVLLAHKGHREKEVLQDLREAMVETVLLVHRVLRVRKVKEVLQVLEALQVVEDLRVLRDRKDLRVEMAQTHLYLLLMRNEEKLLLLLL